MITKMPAARRARAACVPLVALCCVLALTGTAAAQQPSEYAAKPAPQEDVTHVFGLKTGNLTVVPSLSVSEVYDTNIFLADVDLEEDEITNVIPGLSLAWRSDKVEAALASTVRFAFFNDHPDRNAIEPTLNGKFRVAPDKWYVTWGGYYTHTEDPIEQAFAVRLPIDQYGYHAGGGWRDQRWDCELLYEHIDFFVDATEFEFINYEINQGRFRGGYVITNQWKAVVGAVTGHTDYTEEVRQDSVHQEGTVGAQWVPGDTFAAAVDVGYRNQDWDSGSGETLFRQDYRQVVTRLTARWTPTKEDTAILAYSHKPEESVFSNYAVTDRVQAVYRRTLGERWSARANASWSRAEEGDSSVSQPLRDSVSIGTGVTYRVDNGIFADLSYTHHFKRTNDGNGEFDVNQVSLGVSVAF